MSQSSLDSTYWEDSFSFAQTMHAPLQWLSAQASILIVSMGTDTPKYSFTIVYCKGYSMAIPSLSQCGSNVVSTAAAFCSISIPPHTPQEAQHNDPITNTVCNQLSALLKKPSY